MKIFAYLQHHGLPSQKAHSVYITKVAETASVLFQKSFLVFPSYNLGSEKEIATTYALKEGKPYLKKIYTPDLRTIKVVPKKITEHIWYIFSSWIFAIKAYSWLRQTKIDIIQTGDREIIFLCKLFGKPNNLKIIYDVHFDFSTIPYESWLEKRTIRIPDRIIVNCEYLKKKYIGQGIDRQKIFVLPNGYDPSLFNRLSKKKSREKYKIPQNKFVVGYLGRFETKGIEKGIRELLLTAKQLKTTIPICIVAIGGPTSLVNEYQRIASDLGLLPDEAIIRDYVSPNEVGDILASFDVGALLYPPVDYFVEKMSPMKAVEYLAANLKIIATNIPSIKNVCKNKALYIRSFTPEDIEKSIKQLYVFTEKIDGKDQIMTWKQRQQTIIQGIK